VETFSYLIYWDYTVFRPKLQLAKPSLFSENARIFHESHNGSKNLSRNRFLLWISTILFTKNVFSSAGMIAKFPHAKAPQDAISASYRAVSKASQLSDKQSSLAEFRTPQCPEKNSNYEIRQDMCLANFSSQPANVRPTGVRCRRLHPIRENACIFERTSFIVLFVSVGAGLRSWQ
jgi:hypothetical protein